MATTITETLVPSLKIHVLESETQFRNLSEYDPDALYFTPFEVATYAVDEDVVHIEFNETIQGVKTFADGVRLPEPGTLSNAATVNYVNTYGGQVDNVTLRINGTEYDATVVDRYAVLPNIDLNEEYVAIDGGVFSGQRPTYDANGTGTNPIQLALIDEVGVTDVEINSSDDLVTINNGLANLDLSSYVEMTAEIQPQTVTQTGNSIDADTLDGHPASYFAPASSLNNVVYTNNPALSNARTPTAHQHSLTGTHADLYVNVDDSPPELLSSFLSRSFADINHVHNNLKNNANSNYSASIPTLSKNETIALISDLNAKITYGTSGMTAGTTPLATGVLYFQYE